MTVIEALARTREALARLESPRLESERLVAHALGIATSALILQEALIVSEERERWLQNAIARRQQGEPLAYILGTQGFYKHDFFVRSGVLIPRPETELIVTTALRLFPQVPQQIADLGCGSGCIGLSLVKEWPTTQLTGVDLSPIAIQVSSENAQALEVEKRCRFLLADVEKLPDASVYEMIVANPPYIDRSDSRVEANVRKFEPSEALFAADQGFAKLEAWSAWAGRALQPNGYWICEIGTGQNERLEATLVKLGFRNIEFKKDLAGHWRTAIARKT